MPDQQILERARAYEAQALAEIYDRYAGPIYGYLYRIIGDPAHAEDLTGEVFLRLLQVLGTSRAPRDNLAGWLYRVAHNLAMDLFRRQKKGQTVPLDEELLAGDGPRPDVLEEDRARQQLRAHLRRLTSDQQRVILLRFAQDLPLAEVARLMDKSEGAIKALQHRAMNRLRKLLQE